MATARAVLLATVALLAAVGASVGEPLWLRDTGESIKGGRVLLWAAEQKDPALIFYLADRLPGVWTLEFSEYSQGWPLHRAAEVGNADVVAALLASGATTSVTYNDDRTPLYSAVVNGNLAVVRLLLSAGADIQAKMRIEKLHTEYLNAADITLLHLAASLGHGVIAEELLRVGADPQARDSEGRTPADYAAFKGQGSVVKLLIGAAPLCSDRAYCSAQLAAVGRADAGKSEGGLTYLHELVLGRLEFLRSALARGVEPQELDARDWRGRTPLHYAVTTQEPWAVAALLTAGADPMATDRLRRTPLHLAAEAGPLESAKLLLAAGAGPNAADWLGQTALHLAAGRGSEPMVRQLLKAGAVANVPDRAGRLPADLGQSELLSGV